VGSSLVPETDLDINMANKAVRSLNEFNKILDEIMGDKNITKALSKKNDSIGRNKENVMSDEYGRNRSSDDYSANWDSVYLGNTNGLFTKTLTFWVKNLDDGDVKKIIGKQLYSWINSNIREVIKKLRLLIGTD